MQISFFWNMNVGSGAANPYDSLNCRNIIIHQNSKIKSLYFMTLHTIQLNYFSYFKSFIEGSRMAGRLFEY